MSRSAPLARRGATALAAAGAISAGLWVSFHYCLGYWGPDSDTVTPLTIWKGIHDHGLAFIPSWSCTPDNWLLTVVPIASLAIEVFGPRPELMAPLGWLFFISSVAMTAFLAWRLAGPRTALALAAVLLFASFPALGAAGQLGHPVSHDSSMAWALLALILALRSLERGEVASAIAAGACILADSISDPWAVIALDVPMIAVCALIGLNRRRTRQGLCMGLIAGAAVLAFVAIRTRVFGLLGHAVPKLKLHLADPSGLASNLRWAGRALTEMFNVIPGADAAKPGVQAADMGMLVLLIAPVLALSAIKLRGASVGRQLVCGVAILSILGVAGLFFSQSWGGGDYVGRFFPNLYFLGGLLTALVAADAWSKGPRWLGEVICVYAAFFIAGGLASQPGLWTGRQPLRTGVQARTLAAQLAAHGLTYGYGAYWGAEAPTIEWVSQGRIIVRPISFRTGKVMRKGFQDSSFWFRPEDEPRSGRLFILVVTDGEECPSQPRCQAIVEAQFGPPAEQFAVEGGEVLVWNRSLLAQFASLDD